jgi:hypothetical protein
VYRQVAAESVALGMLLARPREDGIDDWLFTAWADSYLQQVATPVHLDAIKQRAATQSLHDRHDTERISRTVRYRELLRRSLPTNAARDAPPVPASDRVRAQR